MDRYAAMKVFVKVAETGSFARTGRLLFMSAPAVTRSVASLEELIGARLFVRTTRAVKITEAGTRYLLDCRRILADIEASELAAGAAFATPTGTLTVTAPELFGQIYVLPILMDYLQQHSRVSGRALFSNRVTNLVDEEIDVAVRIGTLPDSGYRAIRVGSVRSVICGSHAYFDTHGAPRVPQELSGHAIVVVTAACSASQEWKFGGDGGTPVSVHPRLLCNTDQAAISATMAGWGLTRIMVYKIASALMEGRLQSVLSEFEDPPEPIHVLVPEGRHASAKARTFIDLLVERLQQNRVLN